MRSYCSIEEGKGVSKSLNSNSRNLAIASNKTANWWFVGWSLDSSQLAVPLSGFRVWRMPIGAVPWCPQAKGQEERSLVEEPWWSLGTREEECTKKWMRVSFRVVDWLWTFSAGGAGRGAKDDTYAQDDASHKPARPQSKTRIQTNKMLKAAPDAEPPGRSEDRGGGVVSG